MDPILPYTTTYFSEEECFLLGCFIDKDQLLNTDSFLQNDDSFLDWFVGEEKSVSGGSSSRKRKASDISPSIRYLQSEDSSINIISNTEEPTARPSKIAVISKICSREDCRSEKTADGTATKTHRWYLDNGKPICNRCNCRKKKMESLEGLIPKICSRQDCRSEKTIDGLATKTSKWYKEKGQPICNDCNSEKRKKQGGEGLIKKICSREDCQTPKTADGTATKTYLWYKKNGQSVCGKCYDQDRMKQSLEGIAGKICSREDCRSEKTADGTATKTYRWYLDNGSNICARCYIANKKIEIPF